MVDDFTHLSMDLASFRSAMQTNIDAHLKLGYHAQLNYAPVAQGIEYWPPKPRVAGSIPAGCATLKSSSFKLV